jgi:hypothetical protein
VDVGNRSIVKKPKNGFIAAERGNPNGFSGFLKLNKFSGSF